MKGRSHLYKLITVAVERVCNLENMKSLAWFYRLKIKSHKDSSNGNFDYILEGKYCDLKLFYEKEAFTDETFDEWLKYSKIGNDPPVDNPPESDQLLDFGLQSKGNIIRAFSALLDADIYCKLDLPENYRRTGVFMFFDFRNKKEHDQAMIVVAEALGVGLELEEEWPNTVDEVKKMLQA